MKVMVIVKASRDSEAEVLPSERLLTEMGRFNEELVNAGMMEAGEGLRSTAHGARVSLGAGEPSISRGPFLPAEQQVSGFWLWQVKSLDEAIDWAKRIPNPDGRQVDFEIRPVAEAEDFGEAFTPELREQEARLRARSEARSADVKQ
jgi:hypothetical protein